jgi:hypothetical protein
VVDPQTGQAVGGFAGAQTLVGISFHAAAGTPDAAELIEPAARVLLR